MAKQTGKKRIPENTEGITDSVKTTTSALINEIEKAGELVLTEVKDAVVALTGRVSSAAKSVSESQITPLLKELASEIEEIGSSLIESVGQRLDQLRGKVTEETGTTKAKKKVARKKKATAAKKKISGKKKTIAAKKKVTKKQLVAKPRKQVKKKLVKKKVVRKKAASKKRAAPTKKKIAKRGAAIKKKASPKKRG